MALSMAVMLMLSVVMPSTVTKEDVKTSACVFDWLTVVLYTEELSVVPVVTESVNVELPLSTKNGKLIGRH